jgi:peptidoglycan/xylan/chitin deacetylase (PgdA/CDA1 family)
MNRVEIPILMYHEVAELSSAKAKIMPNKLIVEPAMFTRQLDWLAEHGYHTVTLSEAHGFFQERQTPSGRLVALTFDDGYRSCRETVLPALAARGMRGTFFPIPAFFVGQPDYLRAEMVAELSAAGMEIGSHAWSHPRLTEIPPEQLRMELMKSKEHLVTITGKPVEFLCYPFGCYNRKVLAEARRCGYKAAVTTRFGKVRAGSDPYLWPRMRMLLGEGPEEMREKLEMRGLDNARRLLRHYGEEIRKHAGGG